MIRYTDSTEGITPSMLHGFFVGWTQPHTPEKHLRILQNSAAIVLALDADKNRVVGYINALTDNVHHAFIPLLEVLPKYQQRGIGSELMKRLLIKLRQFPCIDLTCDPALQPFYERFGMLKSVGMVVRNY